MGASPSSLKTTRDILRLNEPLPWRARFLFLRDRFPADTWGTGMICRLLCNDRTLPRTVQP
jgi:hypothetical protein